ncbi:MAG: tRNA (adenosine(37)-N6)-threonylcarbamoyltransferase complex ATPase subunit type 1 TsaE [Gammaproteobacteria bacterium]
MSQSLTRYLPDSAATTRVGRLFAGVLLELAPARLAFYFDGELGSGKTALIRALLGGLGHAGRVPSPTYTLVEPYLVARYRVLHVDLYRLRDPAELDDLGLVDEWALDDQAGRGSLLLAEWPTRGAGRLPPPDIDCRLDLAGSGRELRILGRSEAGDRVVERLSRALPADF